MKRLIFAILGVIAFGCTPNPPQEPEPTPIVVGKAAKVAVGSLVRAASHESELVQLDTAVAVRSAVELHLCEQAGLPFVSTAWAHVASSSTREGTPVAEDLLRPSGARITGEISPPFGTYCAAYVIFSAADDDILNMTAISTDDVYNKTLVIRGSRKVDGALQPFEFEYSDPIVIKLELDRIELNEEDNHAQVLIEEGLTPELADALLSGESAKIVSAFKDSVSVFKVDK